jgi:hypothetical protein
MSRFPTPPISTFGIFTCVCLVTISMNVPLVGVDYNSVILKNSPYNSVNMNMEGVYLLYLHRQKRFVRGAAGVWYLNILVTSGWWWWSLVSIDSGINGSKYVFSWKVIVSTRSPHELYNACLFSIKILDYRFYFNICKIIVTRAIQLVSSLCYVEMRFRLQIPWTYSWYKFPVLCWNDVSTSNPLDLFMIFFIFKVCKYCSCHDIFHF